MRDNPIKIPNIGLGLWKVRDQTQFDMAFKAALAAGYRHFDTAEAYGNEAMLGEAWRNSGIKRNEIWITTKILTQYMPFGLTKWALGRSLAKLQTEYVDLLLIHFPLPIARKYAWKQLEKLHRQGKAHHIGVSNYTITHLEQMKQYATIMPAVNQIELHVFFQQPELVEYCHAHDIIVEAYSPLAHGSIFDNPVIKKLAKKYKKSDAQIMLRWCLQNDVVVLPKSTTPSRIKENIDILDFDLTAGEIRQLTELDRGLRTCKSVPDPRRIL